MGGAPASECFASFQKRCFQSLAVGGKTDGVEVTSSISRVWRGFDREREAELAIDISRLLST